MTLSMADFDARYAQLLEKAYELGENDRGIALAKNLFLLEQMEPDVRLAVATMAKVFIGRKIKEVMLIDAELNKVMALSEEEVVHVTQMLGKLSEQMKNG